MTIISSICPKCGAKIFAETRFCGACLLETGLDLAEPDGADQPAASVDGFPSRSQTARAMMEFGDYELLEEIGRGSQGVVYRARQKSLNRTVAIKVIGLGHWATEAHLKRFRREAEAAASLNHPDIVPIYEVGERDGSCFFSMGLVEGGQLDEIAQREAMPFRRAVELMAKLARTIHYAHEHGILHRDIKPGNILLDDKGEPHLTDFGLARLVETESTVTRTMEVLGTPSYMAPEQAAGNNARVSRATDVYGLGAVFYQLLTGYPPFAGGTTYETIRLLLETEPRQPRLWNPRIDRDLSTVCLKCLEKDPHGRYSSALALAEDLERWLRHEPIRARRTGILTKGRKWLRRNPTSGLLVASLVALAVAAGWIVWKSEFIWPPVTTGIAVLPFENLSDEKENAFFADGVQDDILIKLAKIADLKVISRTSVMQYRGKQNLQQISDALRVSHVLEGTVRRSGGKVHVNAQLVDTRTDTDVWAEEYDRDLNDVFAIEAEVAQSIANRLRARVSAREKAAIEERPTRDLVAYDLYVRATPLIERAGSGDLTYWTSAEKDVHQAMDLLNQAIARDPGFLFAYCWLARAHDTLYFMSIDPSSGQLDLANSAIHSALRLRPDSGEAHLALALHLYWGYFDYDHARAELAIARHSLPNNPRAFDLSGLIDRRQGRWPEAVRNFERATELDPRNVLLLTHLASTDFFLRDYQQASDVMDRILVLNPNDLSTKKDRAGLAISRRADVRPLRAFLEQVVADDPAQAENDALKGARFYLALFERDFDAAGRVAETLPEKNSFNGDSEHGRPFYLGLVARMKGDAAGATTAFTAARAQEEAEARARPDFGPILSGLALVDAALGRKEEALREGRRAVELTTRAQDLLTGPGVVADLALIYAWTGERDMAIKQLEIAAKLPNGPDYGDLVLDPAWDSLRADPRFQKIVVSLAPKDVPKQIVSK
jgi:serine/threonine protein kinase/tetratricopeptide (TPR) repeat protein